MARPTDIKHYEEWRLTSPMAILFIAVRRFRRVVRSVIEIVSLGGLTVVLLRFLDVGLVTAILSYAIAMLVFIVVSAILSYLVLRVSINDKGVAMKSGVFRRTHKVVPWDKIRSVNMESGPIERILNLAKISVDTASSMGSEIVIPAVPTFVGNYLRSHVREPIQTNDQETADKNIRQKVPLPTEDKTIFSLEGKDMFIAAICAKGIFLATVIGLGLVIAISANAFLVYTQLNSTNEEASTAETSLQAEVQDTLKEEFETNINIITMFPQMWHQSSHMREDFERRSTTDILLLILGMLVVWTLILIPSLIIGFFIKALIFFVSHKDYRLSQEDSKLICERGLITRKTTTVDIPKVQAMRISLSLRQRLCQRFDVMVQQSDENESIQVSLGNVTHQIAVPCVESQFCREIVREIFPQKTHDLPLDPRSNKIQRFSCAYFFLGLIVVGLPILFMFEFMFWFIMGTRGAILWALVLIPFGIYSWWQCWRRTGYLFHDEFILYRKGFLGYELRVIPISKLQQIEISQSILQKIRNRCTFHFFTHSTTYTNVIKIPFLNRAYAERVRDYLLYRIETSKVRWR